MMKKIMMLIALVAVFAGSLSAQSDKRGNNDKRPNAKNFSEMQLKQMVKKMKLDEATTAKFTPLYQEYQKALKDCRTPRAKKKSTEMTDQELATKIEDGFKQSRKFIDVKEAYYKKFKEVLTIKQIDQMYRIERDNMERLSRERMQRQNRPQRQERPQQRPNMNMEDEW